MHTIYKYLHTYNAPKRITTFTLGTLTLFITIPGSGSFLSHAKLGYQTFGKVSPPPTN